MEHKRSFEDFIGTSFVLIDSASCPVLPAVLIISRGECIKSRGPFNWKKGTCSYMLQSAFSIKSLTLFDMESMSALLKRFGAGS